MAITTISSREFNQDTSSAKKATRHEPGLSSPTVASLLTYC